MPSEPRSTDRAGFSSRDHLASLSSAEAADALAGLVTAWKSSSPSRG